MDTTGLDELNKQGSYLTTLEKEGNQNQWINILQNNPTDAINAYHNALCSNGKNKGYCDLLDLFRIMGALEQVKDGKISLNELNNQHSKELTAIKDDMKELKQSMKSFAPESETKLQEEINQLKSQHEEEKNQLQDKINIQDNSNKEDLRKINEAILKLKQNIQSISPEGLNLNKLQEALNQLNININIEN